MARKPKVLDFKIFVDGRPYEDLTPQEREEFGRHAAQKMGESFNNYFSTHIEEYKKIGQELP